MKKLLLGLFGVLASCGYNNMKTDTIKNPTGEQKLGDDKIDFAVISTQIFQPHCLSCHSQAGGNRAGVNLENYTNTKPFAELVKSEIVDDSMPPDGPLSDEKKKLVVAWVNAGAPEFAQQPAPVPTPAPNPVPPEPTPQPAPEPVPTPTPPPPIEPMLNFVIIKKQVFEPYCLQCHSAAGRNRGKVNLETYDNFLKVKDEVRSEVAGDFMPPRSPLPAKEKEMLLTWIDGGAPEL